MKLRYHSRGLGFRLALLLGAGSFASVGLGQNDKPRNPADKIQVIGDQADYEATSDGNDAKEKKKKVKHSRKPTKEEVQAQRDALKEVGNIDYKKAPPENDKANLGVMGMGKTLPESVLRIRLPFVNTYGKDGFDDKGDRKEMGFEVNVQATALVAEYGISDKISFQFVAPYVYSNKMGMNANTLRANNFLFKREYDRYVGAVRGLLQSQRLCTSPETCQALLDDPNYTIPAAQEIVLTTGEKTIANPTDPTLRQIDTLLMTPITPIDGKTGIGDLQIGALYNFYDNGTLSLSLGGGLRLPTGAFKDVPRGQRAIGGGVTDMGARFNVDYQPVYPLVFSLMYQAEYMLAKGKKSKTSAISNDKLNNADPTDPRAIAIGSDGKGNEQEFERAGVGRSYVARIGYGLAALSQLSPFLQPLGVGVSYNWFKGRETRYDGAVVDGSGLVFDPIPTASSYTVGMSWEGLAFRPLIPLTIAIDHTKFLDGENMIIAPSTTTVQLIGYYKF